MSKIRKALVAGALYAAGMLAAVLGGGVDQGVWLLLVVGTVVTGLGTYGVPNAGTASQLAPVAELARAAYTEYRRVRGGLAYDGSELPDWAGLEATVRDAWVRAQAAAVETPK